MKNFVSFGLVGASLFGALALSACDVRVEPLSKTPTLVASLDVNGGATEGPWAACRDQGDPLVPDQCPDPGPHGGRLCEVDFTTRRLDDDSIACELTAVCTYRCHEDADCPAPESGDVEPVCAHGTCFLPCDLGSSCPVGMTCWHDGGAVDTPADHCVWNYDCHEAP